MLPLQYSAKKGVRKRGLQALDLSNNRIAAGGAKALLQPPLGSASGAGAAAAGDGEPENPPAPPLPALTALSLAANRIGDAGCAVLAPHLGMLPTLRSLDLNGNGIGDAGARALAAHLSAVRPRPSPGLGDPRGRIFVRWTLPLAGPWLCLAH